MVRMETELNEVLAMKESFVTPMGIAMVQDIFMLKKQNAPVDD